MTPSFCRLGAKFRELALAMPQVSPDVASPSSTPVPEITQKPAEWAQSRLDFTPSAKQAEVLDCEAKYLVLCCNRQWGKTTTIAVKALHRALALPDQSIVIISRTKIQAAILIERACRFAGKLGYKIRRALGHQFSLRLPNGSQIFAVAHSQDTSVGNTANVLIVDEAALVKDEVYFAVSSFVSRTHGSIWLMSTPRRQTGFFYNIWHSAETRWHRVLSTVEDCPEIDRDFLDMLRKSDQVKYQQDFECKFIQPANRLFTRELLMRMTEPIPKSDLGPWG